MNIDLEKVLNYLKENFDIDEGEIEKIKTDLGEDKTDLKAEPQPTEKEDKVEPTETEPKVEEKPEAEKVEPKLETKEEQPKVEEKPVVETPKEQAIEDKKFADLEQRLAKLEKTLEIAEDGADTTKTPEHQVAGADKKDTWDDIEKSFGA